MQNEKLIIELLPLLPVILFIIMDVLLCVKEIRNRTKEPGPMYYLPALLSFPAAAVVVGYDCLMSGTLPDIGSAAMLSLLSLSYLISCPASGDKVPLYIFLSVGSFIISLSSLLARDILSRLSAAWSVDAGLVFIAGLLIMISTLLKTKARFSRVRALFSNEQVWRNVLDYSSMLYSMAAMFLMLIFLCSSGMGHAVETGVSAFTFISASAIYYVMFRRRTEDKSYFLGRKKDIHIQAVIRGRLKDNLLPDDSSEGKHMNTMYKKVLNYMEQKKPYLDDSFSLKDLSTSMYTNKVYLSKTINSLSGRNFSQFVNYHRINYSMNLLKEDPFLKINEVAMMSGFHTVVSYNMAFKLFNNETPSDWVRRYRASLVK